MQQQDHFYEVRDIVGRRIKNKVFQYKVLWDGYPDHQFTWEPLAHLSNVCQLVHTFQSHIDQDNNTRDRCPYCGLQEQVVEQGGVQKGDTVRSILKFKVQKGQIWLRIKWRQRRDGRVPRSSWVPSRVIRQMQQEALLQFYEKKVKWIVECQQ